MAVLALDAELARAATLSNRLAAQLRLTWWGDVLDRLVAGEPPREHPVCQALALAAKLAPGILPDLQGSVESRIAALDDSPLSAGSALTWADRTAGAVARASLRLLDCNACAEFASAAGQAVGLAQLRRREPASPPTLAPLLVASLAEANRRVSGLSSAGWPAVAAAALVRGSDRTGRWTGVEKRLRLLWATARGRL